MGNEGEKSNYADFGQRFVGRDVIPTSLTHPLPFSWKEKGVASKTMEPRFEITAPPEFRGCGVVPSRVFISRRRHDIAKIAVRLQE